jgi:2-oxoglutarate ferredoxin oxidoreductase subunit beta
MTGGQMAPTTLIGQKTTTTPTGRDAERNGLPIKVCELLSSLEGAAYVSRVSVHNAAAVKKAGDAILKAFETQSRGLGFSLVEVLSTCPTNWGLEPSKALKWLEENMLPFYPLGEFRTPGEVQG